MEDGEMEDGEDGVTKNVRQYNQQNVRGRDAVGERPSPGVIVQSGVYKGLKKSKLFASKISTRCVRRRVQDPFYFFT
jgi:hypothetical protein